MRVLIGTVGAFIQDATPQQAEIGYSIVGRTRIKATLQQSGQVNSVIAHTFPRLTASLRVMAKCGLTLDGDGEEPGTVRYRLRFNAAG